MTHPRYPQSTIRVDQPQPPRTPPGTQAPPASVWTRFWFTPTSPTGLHFIRVLIGLLCLLWLLPLAGHIDGLLGAQGLFDKQAYREAKDLLGQEMPTGNWGIQYLAGANSSALAAIYWGSISVLVLFTLGIATRLTAILTWVVVVSFTANPVMEYDANAFLAIFAFYLMVGYLFLGQMHGGLSLTGRLFGSCNWLNRLVDSCWSRWRSLRARLFGSSQGGEVAQVSPPGPQPASVAANLALRLLQVHLAIVVVVSGLHKLQFGDWWAGHAFWYLLYPAGQTTLAKAREHVGDAQSFLFVLSLGAYAVLAWQIGFPLFAWRRRWSSETATEIEATPVQKVGGWLIGPRTILLGGALVGCLGEMYLYELPLLGPALVIGCLCYLTQEEWTKLSNALTWLGHQGWLAGNALRKLLAGVPGLRWVAPPPPVTPAAAKVWAKQPEGRENLVTTGRN